MKIEIVCKPWDTIGESVRYPEDAYEWDGMVTGNMREIGKGFWRVKRDKNEKFRAYIDFESFNNDFLTDPDVNLDSMGTFPFYWNEIILNSIKIVRDKKIEKLLE